MQQDKNYVLISSVKISFSRETSQLTTFLFFLLESLQPIQPVQQEYRKCNSHFFVLFFSFNVFFEIILSFLVKHCFVLNSPIVWDQSSSVVVCACLGSSIHGQTGKLI